ncbi:hypothetical protein PAAG_00334 [Paracoccidioides lutzii Pb01]|uniref:Uncharacterized protein n=1 Tax=Paracoccidioides lutzii (strain ATCC MYA-826 / Pb01) TaxID=502779 RepID=C1GP89_PARBA|nr:hypothetical protein PAAG_00334 [Paracoccidioides lutzii Pb01]EEH36011.2 hypothetical protein PAAG_00334 [Paracoccidioides lutzii Pb01]
MFAALRRTPYGTVFAGLFSLLPTVGDFHCNSPRPARQGTAHEAITSVCLLSIAAAGAFSAKPLNSSAFVSRWNPFHISTHYCSTKPLAGPVSFFKKAKQKPRSYPYLRRLPSDHREPTIFLNAKSLWIFWSGDVFIFQLTVEVPPKRNGIKQR